MNDPTKETFSQARGQIEVWYSMIDKFAKFDRQALRDSEEIIRLHRIIASLIRAGDNLAVDSPNRDSVQYWVKVREESVMERDAFIPDPKQSI